MLGCDNLFARAHTAVEFTVSFLKFDDCQLVDRKFNSFYLSIFFFGIWSSLSTDSTPDFCKTFLEFLHINLLKAVEAVERKNVNQSFDPKYGLVDDVSILKLV